IACGLATDGDADRIGLYDAKGDFIDSHHIILLLIHYLVNYKKFTGKVVVAFITTPKVEEDIVALLSLEYQGHQDEFKYIAEIVVR
ncbi:MAG: phosphoglucomutase/phosphomannomutase family protein, partial [Flavobacteriales bacterium]|nr:phosphoglucomutase/phosphomannomutase family protein [Flavobacteriales bacterium]